jgi:hypothetical protein
VFNHLRARRHKEKKKMKNVRLLSLLIAAAMCFGCGPNDRTILKKYETYRSVDPADYKAGIKLELTDSIGAAKFRVSYSNPALAFNKGNVNLLTERLFVVNAENPSECLEVEVVTVEHENTGIDPAKTSYSSLITLAKETAAKYALVCFQGIDKDEFDRAETLPCFFIVSLDKAKPHVLTDIPLSAGELVSADYPKGKFVHFIDPQIYSGTIAFERSKNVELRITLSADATQVTELKLIAEELYLSPPNYVANQNDLSNLFRYSGQVVSMFKESGITYETLKGGRIEAAEPIAVHDGKIVLDNVIAYDLSITDACIYGTVKVSLNKCATKKEYVVLGNITTPQEIPQNILEPEGK